MDREIKIRITVDGKVEVDSSIYKDCKEVAQHLANVLGEVELFTEKEELDTEERIKLESGD